jgi:hypothetical protein
MKLEYLDKFKMDINKVLNEICKKIQNLKEEFNFNKDIEA